MSCKCGLFYTHNTTVYTCMHYIQMHLWPKEIVACGYTPHGTSRHRTETAVNGMLTYLNSTFWKWSWFLWQDGCLVLVSRFDSWLRYKVSRRLNHCPDFDRLHYTKTGEAWSVWSCKWCQCQPKVDRGDTSSKECETMSMRLYLVVSAPSAGVLNVCKEKMYCSWFKTKNMCMKCILRWKTPNRLGRHWRQSCDKMDQSFPLHVCILQKLDGRKAWERGCEPIHRC